ncbi:MAG: tetratricopeptide repeat protein [Bryobacterales bacterium]|nr:tetratricopeptide repeat protein [Bryobacterales bacterium]
MLERIVGSAKAIGVALTALAVGVGLSQVASVNPYVEPRQCATCHASIWASYQKTGMGRAFYKPSVANMKGVAGVSYFHQPSESHFTMVERGGRWYQRRHQVGPDGGETNVMEKAVDYIMGSGNHARTYLHRTAKGTLLELPLGWYADNGGHWAMNPGYDRAAHDGFRREVSYECMFCHNGYPKVPVGHEKPGATPVYSEPLPMGIDCQRCHGPGGKHVANPVRGTIVNPVRLSRERREEVCIQCHLETTSFPLPNSLPRYGKGIFGYQPGQPLGDYWLFFDHAPEAGRGDKFEIVNAVYRMWKSRCFLESKGALECRSCHNPHDVPRGEAAVRHYDQACQKCHAPPKHGMKPGCADCHMPKRRTEDVVHSLATDHLISLRPPAGDLTGAREERHEVGQKAYRGEVSLYYPARVTGDGELYVALAQVIDRSNLEAGIARLTALLQKYPGARAEFWLGLGEAWREAGRLDKAVPAYREAVRRDAKPVFALKKLGSALRSAGQGGESLTVLTRATGLAPGDAVAWNELGLTYQALGRDADAEASFQKAIGLDPDLSEPHNNLGTLTGDLAAFRESVRLSPENARSRFSYAIGLGRARRVDEAMRQLQEAVRIEPEFVDARVLLGDLLLALDKVADALVQYRAGVAYEKLPGRARLGLGRALVMSGDTAAGIEELRKTLTAADPQVRDAAAAVLQQLGVR